jgi:hypothetical protein
MEKVICPHCKRKLKNINAWHYCKQVNIDDLFINKSDEILLAFDTILNEVAQWKDVDVSATKNCVVFVKNKTFLVAKPMSKWLEVKFYSKSPKEDERLYKCSEWNSKYACIFRFQNEQQIIPAFFDYFKDSYLIS